MMKRLAALLVLIALPYPARAVPGAGAGVVAALLTHADAGRGLARPELVRRMAHRARARRRLLSEPARPVRARVRAGLGGGIATNEYLVRLAVGTPPRPVALTLDTGSDLVWTQCAPCRGCFDQGLPLLDPAASSTYAARPGAARSRSRRAAAGAAGATGAASTPTTTATSRSPSASSRPTASPSETAAAAMPAASPPGA